MPNILSIEKQALAIHALVEGSSICSIERMTGIHRDTVMRLGLRVGQACQKMLDETMRGLPCQRLEVDEVWGFVGKKQRLVKAEDSAEKGDVWTYVAIDPETKAVPVFTVGKRDSATTRTFVNDISQRMRDRIQLSSDAMNHYTEAVEQSFGGEVDYAQVIKMYRTPDGVEGQRRYSPPKVDSVRYNPVTGNPDMERVSTSIVECQNRTMRMHCRRLTRLTNAYSKKLENFKAAVALHFGYYNMVKVHSTVRMTPAMALGVSNRIWTVGDLVALAPL